MSRVRPFAIDDIDAVVQLRSKAFAHRQHKRDDELARYFERIFFENPWRDAGLPSLVHLDDSERINGFLGVVPRVASFRGDLISIAVCTQFMVDPAARGLAGVQLVRTLFAGRQDLSLADLANDVSRVLWERLGGVVSPVQSLTWTQPIRPARFRAAESSARGFSRLFRRALRPAHMIADARMASRWRPPEGLETVPLTPALMAAHLDSILSYLDLIPSYDDASTRWLLDTLEMGRAWGRPGGAALRDASGSIVGWFLYRVNSGGTGDVVQVVAERDRHRDVLQAMFADAWKNGLVALTGRGDSGLLSALNPEESRVSRAGTWTLVHSQSRAIMESAARGHAFLSRLEGEWWMSF